MFFNLGTFSFTHDANDGHPILHILHDKYEARLRDPHLEEPLPQDVRDGSWSTEKVAAGMLKTKETDKLENTTSGSGELNMNIRSWK
jgi:hypothetical protein